MHKKNPADSIQSDQILFLTKQSTPSSSSSSDKQKKPPQKKKDSSGREGSGTRTHNTSNYVYISDSACDYPSINTTINAAADGVNLFTAANIAYGDPLLTPAITVPPGPNTRMTSGTNALSSSDVFPVTQVCSSGPSGDFSSSGAVSGGGGGDGNGGDVGGDGGDCCRDCGDGNCDCHCCGDCTGDPYADLCNAFNDLCSLFGDCCNAVGECCECCGACCNYGGCDCGGCDCGSCGCSIM